jgi:hypothetical protein
MLRYRRDTGCMLDAMLQRQTVQAMNHLDAAEVAMTKGLASDHPTGRAGFEPGAGLAIGSVGAVGVNGPEARRNRCSARRTTARRVNIFSEIASA